MAWLVPKAVFDGTRLCERTALHVVDGAVAGLVPVSELPDREAAEFTDRIVGPGLLDIQVNGGGGVMLNNSPTPSGVRAIAEAHRRLGTSRVFPTVITDRFEVTERAALAVLSEFGRNGVAGIHIEGPHINPLRRGAHRAEFIRPFDARTRALLETLRKHELPVLLTLAPECVEPGDIARLTSMGIVVSAGHTAANAAQVRAALREGLRCFTHLFNGMPPMTSRNPGVAGTAINSEAWCSIIADGHHVDDAMCALAIRARPRRDRMIVVSDAMATTGGPDRFELYGETIRARGGRLVNSEGSLAGAHIDLKTSVERLIAHVGLPIEDAWAMATTHPRALMGFPEVSIVGQNVQDLSCIDPNERSRHGMRGLPLSRE